ncbi:MAG: PA2169 family four-helix-bundle protein [Tunicatimonas sp.]
METNKELVKDLNGILEKHNDAVRGYDEAAEKAKSPSLKTFLQRNAGTRKSFVTDLKQEVMSLGGDPDTKTSAAADIHRGWINFKTALSSNKDEAVLEECIRGEDAALKEYDSVLKDYEVPQGLRNKLQDQRNQIQQAKSELKSLELQADARN